MAVLRLEGRDAEIAEVVTLLAVQEAMNKRPDVGILLSDKTRALLNPLIGQRVDSLIMKLNATKE